MAGKLIVSEIEDGTGVSQGTNPTGTVIMFYGSVPPTGYLECNGQSTTGFDDLIAIVGANVPDLRGEFIRGWDNGKGTDSGRTLGSSQEATATRQVMDDAFGNDVPIATPSYYIGQQYSSADSTFPDNTFTGDRRNGSGGPTPASNFNNVSKGALVTNEPSNVDNWITHRPRNVALMYCIKT